MTEHRAGAVWPLDGGEMAALIRRFDWSTTPLGPVASWQPPLRTAVSLMLAARTPVFLFWSTELRCLYNDAARKLLGPEQHPLALGARVGDAWSLLENEVRKVLAGGPATWQEDRLLPVARQARGTEKVGEGGLEDAWWTCSCSPVADEAAPSGVGGVLALCTETTLSVLARHESDRRLSESEARFREIANAAPMMIWMVDETQACTWVNAPWLRFTGRTLEQTLGSGWIESIHPDDVGRCLEAYAEASDARRPFRMDLRLRRHDGQWRVVDSTGAPRLDDDGVLLGFIGSCMDVTRQRETEARFRGVFNADLMGMTVFDANTGETLAVNDCFLRMTGHTRADFDEGRWTRADFNRPENDARDAEAILQARQRGWWDPFEKVMRRQDGSCFPARVSSAPLPGEPGRVVIAIQDITAERAAQAALVASEERLRLGLEAGRMVTWEFDLRTRALTRSANAEVLFGPGATPEDFSARMPQDDIEADHAELQRALADPEGTYDSVFRYNHPDGRLIYLHNWGQVQREADGTPARIHGVCMDITERKQAEAALQLLNETLEQQVETRTHELMQAEEALRQSQKMEALGHLTGGVAHDFNNLLGAMVGSFELIRRKHDDKERVRSLADAGLKAAERGAKLTSQLLTFSRSQRIELKPVVAAQVVDGMRDMLRRTLGPLIAVGFDVECAAAVLSDATQLEMAVLNLAINARDAMPEGGHLTISTRLHPIDRDPGLAPGDYLELRVSDTGVGMSPDVIARAFDPFFTTKGVGKGTGLGLSQVYGIARQAGGTVRIDSAPGAGTTVRMLLPCTQVMAHPAEAAPSPALGEPAPDATILVVDDDPDLRRVLAASLEDLGYCVLEADNGASGMLMLQEHAADLLIVDFAMPGMTGAELAKAARALRPELPVVFISGYADTDAIDAAMGPATRILRKPFRVNELQAALSAALAARVV